MLLRVFGNINENCVSNGSLVFNGSGKFSDITPDILDKIKKLSVSHIWYTGVIEHTTCCNYIDYGIKQDDPLLVKGLAGSPYSIKDYYDVNPYLADDVENRIDEFKALIERTHNAGLKVIIDFIPNHVARNYNSDSKYRAGEDFGIKDTLEFPLSNEYSNGFNTLNNFYYIPNNELNISSFSSIIPECQHKLRLKLIKEGKLEAFKEYPAKVTGNDSFTSTPGSFDWWDTVKLNYGIDYLSGRKTYFSPIPDTWLKMYDVLKFWLSLSCDGFRCDMVEMVPVEFWHWAIAKIKKDFPDSIFVAEIYDTALYDSYINYGGFDYLYDKVGLYDTLKSVSQTFNDKIPHKEGRLGYSEASDISKCWQSLANLQCSMLNFLENHDEQRIASDFNMADPFKAIPELTVSLILNTNPFMIYFGQEYGERGMLAEGYSGVDGRTSIFDFCSAPSIVRAAKNKLFSYEQNLYELYCKLLAISMNEKAIRCGLMYDLEYANFNNTAFDTRSQFVFARIYKQDNKQNGELILVAVDFNLSNSDSMFLSPILPEHFFKFCGLEHGKSYECTNILNNYSYSVILNADSSIQMPKNEYGISIIKVNF